jgi:hypothetical protein
MTTTTWDTDTAAMVTTIITRELDRVLHATYNLRVEFLDLGNESADHCHHCQQEGYDAQVTATGTTRAGEFATFDSCFSCLLPALASHDFDPLAPLALELYR